MPLNPSGHFNEVDEGTLISTLKTVGTSEVLIAVGSSNLVGRQSIIFQNRSQVTLYVGPSGLTSGDSGTGEAVYPQQTITRLFGENINYYVIASTSGPHNFLVQESS